MKTAAQAEPVKSSAVAAPASATYDALSASSQLDQRPGTITQRQQLAAIGSSPRVQQAATLQRAISNSPRQQDAPAPVQRQANKTGLPDDLKAGVENLSGHSLDDVKVHYNSAKPAKLQAHAYAQGTDIHVAPGQEQHLPHEAWHVVQQMQGRVRPTMQLKGKVAVNDDAGLEKEADTMGSSALAGYIHTDGVPLNKKTVISPRRVAIQRVVLPWKGDESDHEGGRVGFFYSTEHRGWFPTKAIAERYDNIAISKKNSARALEERQVSSASATQPKPGRSHERVPAESMIPIPSDETERRELSENIAKRIHEDAISTKPRMDGPVKTPVFSAAIKAALKTTGKVSPQQVYDASKSMTLPEITGLMALAVKKAAQWPLRNNFREHRGTYQTFSPSPEYFADTEYKVEQEELMLWDEFLGRNIVLGRSDLIKRMQESVRRIQQTLAEGGPSIMNLLKKVNLHSKLKAERMKLSGTVSGAGNSVALEQGKGDEVANNTPDGIQWQRADSFMLGKVKDGKIGELPSTRPELTPDLILAINQAESSNKGLVNSQAAGELRYSAIALGSKGEESRNLRLVPPAMIAAGLAGLINGVNEQLTHIRAPGDIWEIIPITGRFYTDFIAIHPFSDGNGRTARKVVDFLLLSYGLPPAQFDNRTKNFGAGIPDKPGKMMLERQFDDITGVYHVMQAVEKAFVTLTEKPKEEDDKLETEVGEGI